ncbi:MAG: GNAT family N-acetyltransferase [Polyangiaceae bacterium]
MEPNSAAFDTERLTFRLPGEGELEAACAVWSDPDVVRYVGGKPFGREEVWTKILRGLGMWHALGYGYWAVRERSTGAYVGEVGFADFHRDMVPSIEGVPEGGWVLAKAFHGRGFATEAVTAALGWLDRHVPASRSVCIIDGGNLASRRVAAKCGYVPVTETAYKGTPVTLFERPSPRR